MGFVRKRVLFYTGGRIFYLTVFVVCCVYEVFYLIYGFGFSHFAGLYALELATVSLEEFGSFLLQPQILFIPLFLILSLNAFHIFFDLFHNSFHIQSSLNFLH